MSAGTFARTAFGARLPLISLLSGNLISSTGSRVSSVAIPWYVLTRTGSAESTGLAAAVSVVSAVLAGTLTGALVDRFGHKRAKVGEHMGIALGGMDRDRLTKLFAALAEGSAIKMPLAAQPGGGEVGWLSDKFGINWTVMIHKA